MIGYRAPIQTMHVGKPWRKPESLQCLEARLAKHKRRCKPPELDARKNPADHAELLAPCFAMPRKLSLRHDEKNEQRCGEAEKRKPDKKRSPAERAEERLYWRGRRERADAADRDHPARKRRQPLARKPERERLDRAHEAGGDAKSDERASCGEHREIARQSERQRAGSGDAHERGSAAPRSEAIEQHAKRQLERSESKKVRAREKPEIARCKREVLHQILRNHRVHVAIEVREVVARREGAEHHKDGVRGYASGHEKAAHRRHHRRHRRGLRR